MKQVFFLLFLISLVMACQKEGQDAPIVGRDAVLIETGKEVDVLYSDSARVRARIQGPLLERHIERTNPREIFSKGILVTFFDTEGKPQSTLTAHYAIRSGNKLQTVIRDSVVWQSIQGERLETSELIWDEKQQFIYSDKFVKITRPGEVAFGYGFRTNSEFSNWRINAIEGVFKTQAPAGL